MQIILTHSPIAHKIKDMKSLYHSYLIKEKHVQFIRIKNSKK